LFIYFTFLLVFFHEALNEPAAEGDREVIGLDEGPASIMF
jgi:hypothetical protein